SSSSGALGFPPSSGDRNWTCARIRAAAGTPPRRAGSNVHPRAASKAASANGLGPSMTVADATWPSEATTSSSTTTASPCPSSGYATSWLPLATGGAISGPAATDDVLHQTATAKRTASHQRVADACTPLFAGAAPILHHAANDALQAAVCSCRSKRGHRRTGFGGPPSPRPSLERQPQGVRYANAVGSRCSGFSASSSGVSRA